MNDKIISVMSAPFATPAPFLLLAEPESLEIELQRTVVVVVDMQNAFVTKGGMFDLMGMDISTAQKIVEPIIKITSIARGKGIKVIYIVQRYSLDLRESGGPNSPRWYKGLASYREHPDWQDKFLIRGTWGANIIEELKPEESDIVVEKPTFSGFFGTNLDIILRTDNIKYLAFVGTTTNICVEASIRDATYLGYWPILISDATANVGPTFMQDATIFNVKLCYGWVTTSENFVKAIQ